MRRFYASPERFQDNLVTLDKDETYHLARVLRLGLGARVEVGDGRGGNFEAVVTGLDSQEARLQLVRRLDPWGEPPLPLVLGIGLAKGDALDGVIRQATEMGVHEILPFVSERSERPDPGRTGRRLARWQRLARESLKSCQRSVLPHIHAPREFGEVLAAPAALKLIFWEDDRGGGLQQWLAGPRPGGVLLLIGPEGGFSSQEVAAARDAGFRVASLGPRRLKVETAALAALTLLQYAWGDLA
jgi:16S rRNA (uracil1498-N3)-methyltransferase